MQSIYCCCTIQTKKKTYLHKFKIIFTLLSSVSVLVNSTIYICTTARSGPWKFIPSPSRAAPRRLQYAASTYVNEAMHGRQPSQRIPGKTIFGKYSACPHNKSDICRVASQSATLAAVLNRKKRNNFLYFLQHNHILFHSFHVVVCMYVRMLCYNNATIRARQLFGLL